MSKNVFEPEKMLSVINAEKAEPLMYGYFSNTVAGLRQAVEDKRINLKVIYARLEDILDDSNERRFTCAYGNFSLFYPLDQIEKDERY